jgi:hypothetical protein
MRKILAFAVLLAAAALLSGAPAKADMGCGCVKLGAPATCTATMSECMNKVGGLCLAPCDYVPPKKTAMAKHKKTKM